MWIFYLGILFGANVLCGAILFSQALKDQEPPWSCLVVGLCGPIALFVCMPFLGIYNAWEWFFKGKIS